MLRFYFLFVLFATCASAKPAAHVFLIIGQSNAVGSNYNDGFTDEDASYPNILQLSTCFDNQNQSELIQAHDPLHHFCDQGYLDSYNIGFGMSFAREFRANMPEEDIIVLIPAAIGGTGFNDGVWVPNNGTGWYQAYTRTWYAFLALADKYPEYLALFEGMLWHQGENDASVTADEYLNKDLIPLIQSFRTVDGVNFFPFTNPDVPFVVGQLVPAWVEDVTQPWRAGVLTALQLVGQFVHRTATAPSYGLQPDPKDPLYPVHFNAASQRILGKRYYAAYKEALLNMDRGALLRYKACIAAGLALGCIGDACLVFPSTFVLGMIAFAAGHLFYIYAFGFSPLKALLGVFLFSVCSILLIFVREGVDDALIKDAMPFYSALLVTMSWRALARVKSESLWSKVRGAGGVLFLISDFLLILQFQMRIPYGEMLVLTTYYSSQMCTALSILDTSS